MRYIKIVLVGLFIGFVGAASASLVSQFAADSRKVLPEVRTSVEFVSPVMIIGAH